MLDHDYGDEIANVHSDVSETCDWEDGCDVCAEYVVRHDGNTFYLCPDHMDRYEADHPRCSECGSADPVFAWSWWDGFAGQNVTSNVCEGCADRMRSEDPDTDLVRLAVAS